MLLLFAQAAQPFKLDGTTWAIIVATATALMAGYKFLDKFIEAKLAAKKEKNGNGTGCVGRSGPLPLCEKSLPKAVDEIHEVMLMGQPVSEVQRQRNEGHKALLNTSDFQERNFEATRIVARELLWARKGGEPPESDKGKKPKSDKDRCNDTDYWDEEVDKLLKKERRK